MPERLARQCVHYTVGITEQARRCKNTSTVNIIFDSLLLSRQMRRALLNPERETSKFDKRFVILTLVAAARLTLLLFRSVAPKDYRKRRARRVGGRYNLKT